MKKIVWLLLASLIVLLSACVYQGDLPREVVDAKYANAASEFLILPDGARIHFRDEGAREGLPLVLIHGSMASLHTWEPWVQQLGEDYRLITLDLPAHGLTGAVPSGDYSAAAQERTLQAVVDHLALDQFVLGGSSMGGGVAWRYAAKNLDRVLGLVLVSASGPSTWFDENRDSDRGGSAPMVFSLLRQPWFRAIAARIDPYVLAVQGAKAAYNDSPVVTDALITRYYELALRAGTRAAILGRFDKPWQRSESPGLESLKMPALILWGEQDSVIPAAYAWRFDAALPASEVIVYEGVGHAPMEEIPVRSAADVKGFIRSYIAERHQALDQ
jgi:pimeloyl-ACP methyl ester carboxylesterase